MNKTAFENVVLHPLVMLSVVDHYNRVAANTPKRVVGILLGEVYKGRVDVTNSYAVPFEEDKKDPKTWFLDHTYHEDMYAMFKKVNAKEKVLGWYSTGPKIRQSDLDINELMRKYTSEPILIVIDVKAKDTLEVPVNAYVSVPNRPEEQSKQRRTFMNIPSEIGAEEAEEVGVEHLLRNITDNTTSSIADKVKQKLDSLKTLFKRMQSLYEYVDLVAAGKIPVNHQVMYNLQDIVSLCPDINNDALIKGITHVNNDNLMVLYISSVIRSITALNNLIENKLKNIEDAKEKPVTAKKEETKKEEKKEKETKK